MVGKLNGSGADGFTVTLSGDESASTTAGSDGSYTFRVPDGSYTVTPSQANWGFAPTDSSFAVAGAAVASIDFVTRTVLRTPALAAPADALTDAPLTPTFEWTRTGPAPDTWTLRIDDDSDVTDAPLATLEVNKDSTNYTLDYAALGLDYSSTYWWSITGERTTPQLGAESQSVGHMVVHDGHERVQGQAARHVVPQRRRDGLLDHACAQLVHHDRHDRPHVGGSD